MPRSLPSFPAVGLALVLAAGCGKSPEPAAQQAPAVPTAVHMAEHFSKVREIEEAVIRGDVEAAKEPARWIADHQEASGFPARTERPIKEMQTAARSVLNAENINDAAAGAASLVGACGSCHAAAKASPNVPPPTEGTAETERKRHMLAHQHAVDLMYRGLIAPLSGDWTRGAEALKAAPLGGKALADVSKEAVAAETRVHELADRAIGAAEQSSRVAIYGSVIAECARCHGLHGRIWGPGLPKTE